MRLKPVSQQPARQGVTLFGVVLMLSIVGAFALLLAVIIPNIRQEGLNVQRLNDVDSIHQALTSYIRNNDAIPKSWNDVQDQIDLDHYDIDSVFRGLGASDIEQGLEAGRKAASQAKDYVGIFARSQCDQPWVEGAVNQDLIKAGDERQIAILYVLEGAGLVCDQINQAETGSGKTPAEPDQAETETTEAES